jgi:XRE family transcriptional regulator, regulator of sulfur utilization
MNSRAPKRHQTRQLLANNIRILRAARKLTQQELAEKASMDRGFLLDLESGKRRASVDTLDKLSRAFGVAPHELLMPRDTSAR